MKVLSVCFLISYTVLYGAADPERCTLPVKKGPCQASISNYYYNTNSGRCEQFMYSGCGGNDNRFMSMDDCIQSCSCHIRPDAGPCKAVKERWYYNPSRGCCEKFLYGGCQGNSNNFQSYEACNKMCSGSFTISLKPAGLNWGSMKISSISGDRSMGGTFGKKFGGSRTVWLHSEKVPVIEKGVLTAMSKSGGIALPGANSNLHVIGREITGPGLVPAEKTSKSWSSGPIQTGVRRTVKISSSGPVVTGGMTGMTSGSGTLMGQGIPDFATNSISGKLSGQVNPGGLAVSRRGGLVSGGSMGEGILGGRGGSMGRGILGGGGSMGGGLLGRRMDKADDTLSGGGFGKSMNFGGRVMGSQRNPMMGRIAV